MTTTSAAFREVLRDKLLREHKVLLRLVVPPALNEPVELGGRQIVEMAERLADQYGHAAPAGVVLLLLPHSPELFLLHLGLLLRGRLPAILAWPTSRIDPEKYQRNLLHQLRNLPAEQVITLPSLAGNIGPGLPYLATACSIESGAHYERLFSMPLALGPEDRPPARTAPPEVPPDALFLQFSGGTTGVQKAVVVTAPMLEAQLALMAEVLQLSDDDSIVSWLPMYHDMGLIACLWFPLWHGKPSLHIGANDWVMNPELLFRYADRYRGTLCWLPNFSFAYLAQRRSQIAETYRLSSMRAWINCSEPVRMRSMMQFAEAFGPWGVRPDSLQASYAMAENVFAITQTGLGKVPMSVPRNSVRNAARQYQDLAFDLIDNVFVSSGHCLRQMEVRIRDASGRTCGDREAGEILIRTPCLFGGYWGSQGFRRTTLSEDGWHATGDYGFLNDGELFVIGRLKDIVIVGGQNVFPEDVEAVVNTVPGVHPGRVITFGVDDREYGTEALTVIAEMKGEYDPAAAVKLEKEIRNLVLATIGMAPRYVAAVPERWIVKSTAGKMSRRDTRERFVRERLQQHMTEGA